ncbi:MAG: dTDP-4-dehydrorhamnose 3 5-epimerase [Erysipelotrichaceae bacterium]|nr:MAG: dTDP-4-dehydrorhamnose 3 [Erysipelotrichaceae bacterium]TXT18453.1 MAG: dTDP-4-dehydrorhamnose 3 5-epimerase [Erysipelotrichaceae bacterium]
MKKTKTELIDAFIIEPNVISDSRGWFVETYSAQKFSDLGIGPVFVQDNHSMSKTSGVLRGLHFQLDPAAQTKIVRCTKGKILDVIVDLRKGSPTYKKWLKIELSEDNFKQLYIPQGFAHGFLTLVDDVEIQYKVDCLYSKDHDRSIRFDDPEIGVDWGITNPILSKKDLDAPLLKDSDCNFIYKGDMK